MISRLSLLGAEKGSKNPDWSQSRAVQGEEGRHSLANQHHLA